MATLVHFPPQIVPAVLYAPTAHRVLLAGEEPGPGPAAPADSEWLLAGRAAGAARAVHFPPQITVAVRPGTTAHLILT